jgi:hypothetical protein
MKLSSTLAFANRIARSAITAQSRRIADAIETALIAKTFDRTAVERLAPRGVCPAAVRTLLRIVRPARDPNSADC